MDDSQLLKDYSENGSESAFTMLTERYVNLVYSAACRQVRDPHLAEEISQAVFILLARKAPSIGSGVILSGWLLRTTRYMAANAVRLRARRQQYEEEAMATILPTEETQQVWEQIAPQLDEALVSLREKDRAVVALRFFEQKTFKQIASALGTTEDNAQKRVSRALDKLRQFFKRRDCSIPALALAAALTANSVHSAPTELGAQVAASALGKAAVAASVAAQVSAVLALLARLRLIKVALSASFALLVLLATFSVYTKNSQHLSATNRVAAKRTTQPLPAKPASNALTTIDAGETNQFKLRVVDLIDGLPLANARLTLDEHGLTGWLTNVVYTDRDGFGFLPSPRGKPSRWSYRVEVYHDGYVPMYVSWGDGQGDLYDEFPSDYVVKAGRGARIGGVVLNEKKEPIQGAQIIFSVSGEAPGTSHERERLTMMSHYHRERTDANGRWHCDHVPRKFGVISFELRHPEYQTDHYAVDAPENPYYGQMKQILAQDFLTEEAVMTMHSGLLVSGKVVDENDLPIRGAQVAEPDIDMDVKATTDSDGSFGFHDASPRQLKLFVRAENFAPTNFEVSVRRGMEPLRIVLAPGGKLLGRVVDETGQPIAAANVELAFQPQERKFSWKTTTDSGGRFEWNSAPLKEQAYGVGGTGRKYRKVTLLADGTEHTITLEKLEESLKFNPTARVRVRAVDVETKLPLDTFDILVTERRTEDKNSGWSNVTVNTKAKGYGGRGNFSLGPNVSSFVTEVRAYGHMPARQTNSPGAQELSLNFELGRAEMIHGVVQLPDGRPVSDATAVLCTKDKKPRMEHGGIFLIRNYENLSSVETDAKGEFFFQPAVDATYILVAHKLGFAHVSLPELETSKIITLLPWGRVEGVLKLGDQPVAGRTIILENSFQDFPLQLYVRVKTDAEGRFVFENVPPGELSLGDLVPALDGKLNVMIRSSHRVQIVTRAGEMTEQTIGGNGRTIIGRGSLSGVTNIDWQHDLNLLSLKVSESSGPPGNPNSRSDIRAAQAFWKSPEGKVILRARREYVLEFAPDGSFRLDCVPPGEYRLKINLSKARQGANSPINAWEAMGSLDRDIVVPEGDDNTLLDLGTLELKSIP